MSVIRPRNDKQMDAVRSNCDIVIITGSGGCGKSYIASMYNSYDILVNKGFSATYLRKNIQDFFIDGGIASMMMEIYPLRSDKDRNAGSRATMGEMLTSPGKMGVYFDNGATLRFKHIAIEDKDKLESSFKGIQTNRFIFDEADEFAATTIFYVPTRLRGKGEGKRQVVIIQNPERECFVRQFCGSGEFGGGWIADDGEIIPENNGSVRFFHIIDGDINQVWWGKTKKEVYDQCQEIIDKHVNTNKRKGLNVKWQDFIQSCVFFHMETIDNKEMLDENPDYLASLAMSSGAKSMYSANWNYSKHDAAVELGLESKLNYSKIASMFHRKPNINDKLRIVIDPAREGVDNFTMKAYQGFHCFDFWYEEKTNAKDIPYKIQDFMRKHGATNRNLIIDGSDGFEYIQHNFEGAFMYNGRNSTSAKGKEFRRIRDEAAFVMCEMIERGLLTYDEKLANMRYSHQLSKKDTTLLLAMSEEARVFVFNKTDTNKIGLLTKKDQSAVIRGRSSDLMDLPLMLCGALIWDCYRELAGKQGRGFDSANLIEDITTYNQPQGRLAAKNIADLFNANLGI